MTPGKLRKKWSDETVEATCGPDGWQSAAVGFAARLDAAFPVGGTTAGAGWVQAFWAAVKTLGAKVLTEPVADFTPGQIY